MHLLEGKGGRGWRLKGEKENEGSPGADAGEGARMPADGLSDPLPHPQMLDSRELAPQEVELGAHTHDAPAKRRRKEERRDRM